MLCIYIKDAIDYRSFFEEHATTLKVGDVEAVMESCEYVIADEVKIGGQIHFYMEPQSGK